jgi:hypothetical protein
MKPTTKLRDGLRQISSWAAWLAMEAQGRLDWTEIIKATLFLFQKQHEPGADIRHQKPKKKDFARDSN